MSCTYTCSSHLSWIAVGAGWIELGLVFPLIWVTINLRFPAAGPGWLSRLDTARRAVASALGSQHHSGGLDTFFFLGEISHSIVIIHMLRFYYFSLLRSLITCLFPLKSSSSSNIRSQ